MTANDVTRVAVAAAVADAHRRQWAYVLAATVRVTRNLDLAEECVQDAYTRALASWTLDGIPIEPGAWLTTVARRRALDVVRHHQVGDRVATLLVVDEREARPATSRTDVSDDRLRLLFTCCHPSLNVEAQVALSLRFLCGLSTPEVAKAFLVKESTMAARLTRAKQKIAVARIPYRVPGPLELTARVDAVLAVIHLLYTTGHTAPVDQHLSRVDLVERSLDLARMCHELLPEEGDVTGLLALILLSDARRGARVSDQGHFIPLAEQDRTTWHRGSIDEGLALVGGAIRRGRPGRYTLMAAIAAVHANAPSWDATDWVEIVGLYDLLLASWPSPVVALNRAVALSYALGPREGLAALDELSLEPQLTTYPYLAAARGDCLSRLGRADEARDAFHEALLLSENQVEREHLRRRIGESATH